MNRLWIKLTLAFLATALIAVGVVAALTMRNTGSEFRQYIVRTGVLAQPGLVEGLTAYYTEHGSWEGVETLLEALDHGQQASGAGRGRGRAGLVLADAAGQVVYSLSDQMLDQQLPRSTLATGVEVTLADGRPIGTLLNVSPVTEALDTQGQAFLDRVGRSLIWAGLLAVGVALVLGFLISRQLTAPLRKLTEAAGMVAGGNLAQRVHSLGGDEIGELGQAFNHMAASLQQGETLRRNLMADVAHELRTPLTVVQGNLQAMLDGVYPLDATQIASAYDETRLLTRLVEDLRELALAEAGQLRLQRTRVNLAALARNAVANFTPAAAAASVTLTVEAAPDVPAVNGDSDRLGQVLRNLLGNALRHTPPGGCVTVRVRAQNGQAQLSVTDTGTGIAPDDLPHVFDRFYRGDQGRAGSGTGLGLTIARQFVLAHGGDITVRSRQGQGATFTVTLPALAAP